MGRDQVAAQRLGEFGRLPPISNGPQHEGGQRCRQPLDMVEHVRQMKPPDYHSCVDEVLRSSSACRMVVETLANMSAAEAELGWRNSRREGEDPPPHGPGVAEQIPAPLRVIMLENALKAHPESTLGHWQRLADIMSVPIRQQSLVELIESVRMVREHQLQRITELDARVRELETSARTGDCD